MDPKTSSPHPAIQIHGTKVVIHPALLGESPSLEVRPVLPLAESVPTLQIYEGDQLLGSFGITPIAENPDLKSQYLHASLRILPFLGVMIDGLISREPTLPEEIDPLEFEGIRFQPLLLSGSPQRFEDRKGLGLFARGLHFSGYVTPTTIRLCCLCDECKASFSIQSFHMGFSDSQYFYSEDGTQTLILPNGSIPEMPQAGESDLERWREFDRLLPPSKVDGQKFSYENSFRCPHCHAAYIDFGKYPAMRASEYYGNLLVGRELERLQVLRF